jgi:hypothetical protein
MMKPFKSTGWRHIALWALVFAVTFALRTSSVGVTGTLWFRRSHHFLEAVREGDWANTYQRRHPGVITMAIGAGSLALYQTNMDTPSHALIAWAIPPEASTIRAESIAIVIGIALVNALLVVSIGLALKKLSSVRLALIGTGLLIFSPYYLALSRIIHVDALMSSFMLLSALLLLIYLEQRQRRFLLLSGIVGGFAILTKVPGIFLIPFAGLGLLSYLTLRLHARWADHAGNRTLWILTETWYGLILPLILWIACALLPSLFWPAMWVDAAGTLNAIFVGAQERVTEPHLSSHFFAGVIRTNEALGLQAYGVYFLFLTTGITLTLIAFALIVYSVLRRRIALPVPPITFWLMIACILFFTIEISLGARQTPRYLLPALVMGEIVAAVGAAALVELVQRALPKPEHARSVGWILPALIILLQAAAVMPYAPDYGAHHNALLGGNRTAVQVMEIAQYDEGAVDAINYLNDQPDASSQVLGTIIRDVDNMFVGEIDWEMESGVDYYLFGIDMLQRQVTTEVWGKHWQRLHDQQPEVLVLIDGVPFAYLYRADPALSEQHLVIRRGGPALIGIAWAWALALIGLVVYALRHHKPYAAPVLARSSSSQPSEV